jgi:hypothetical protein
MHLLTPSMAPWGKCYLPSMETLILFQLSFELTESHNRMLY